jgi:hypothetical protein
MSTAYPHNSESELITFLIESCASIQIDRFKVHTINTRPTFRAHILLSRVANFIAKLAQPNMENTQCIHNYAEDKFG